jgi:hypothetical protein
MTVPGNDTYTVCKFTSNFEQKNKTPAPNEFYMHVRAESGEIFCLQTDEYLNDNEFVDYEVENEELYSEDDEDIRGAY